MKENINSKVGSTPVLYDEFLECFLKLECTNPSGSHKDREAFYIINKFGRDKKYIVASSGNAGISLAHWMRENAVVLVPEITPKEKIETINKFGAQVIVRGKYFYDSYKLVGEIAQNQGFINISPGFVERWMGDVAVSYELKAQKQNTFLFPAPISHCLMGLPMAFKKWWIKA